MKRRRIAGGDINDAYEVELDDGARAFQKTRDGAPPDEYPAEAANLRWLAEAGALRVPRVLAVSESALTLEWIDAGRLDAAGEEELGRGLARLHQAGAEQAGFTPHGGPLRIGPLTFDTRPAPDWPSFYAERLLMPLAERAGVTAAVAPVCESIHDLAGPHEPPARLHGDLWSGNVMAGSDGRPWLIDPASYGGHREVDLAMLELFGGRAGPGSRTLAAYEEVAPLAAGRADRVALYQLFPLLVHAVLFGGSYVASAENAARRYK